MPEKNASAAQWQQFITEQMLPVIDELLRQRTAPVKREVGGYLFVHQKWGGVNILSPKGDASITWATYLIGALRGDGKYRNYTIECVANKAPKPGHVGLVAVPITLNTSNAQKLNASAAAAAKEFGADRISFELKLLPRS